MKQKMPVEYKILKVIEADKIYIDFNKNNKIDDNELCKIKGISAFAPIKSNYISQISKKLNLSLDEYLKVGLISRTWAKENLTNKNVLVFGLNSCFKGEICAIDFIYDKQNYSNFLLENGLAYPSDSNKIGLFSFDMNEVKNNANALSKIKYFVLNLNSKILHKATCEHAKDISLSEIVFQFDLDLNDKILCKTCFETKLNTLLSKINIPKNKRVYNNSPYKNFGNVDLYLINPLKYKKPNSKCETLFCKRLIKEINSAKESIDVALYGFGEQEEIFQALKNAKERGIKIRALADFSENNKNNYSMNEKFINEFDAVVDKSTSLMHNKFFIFDEKIVMSGSVNISSSGSGGYNSNIAAFINDFEIAKIYKAEFNQMFNSKFSKEKSQNLTDSSKSDIQVYFSPQDDVFENVLKELIFKAKRKIYVSSFYLTHEKFISELIFAKKRGVEVLVLVDATSANGFKEKIIKLRKNNIPTIVEDWGGKNHEKTIMIDDEILIFGSCNFTKSGFYKNDENMLVFRNIEMAKFYSDYFLFLFNSIDKKFLISIPRAEGLDSKNSCFDGLDNNFDGKIDFEDVGCKAN